MLSKCIYVYRQQNADSITANIGRKNLEDICNVIEKYSEIVKEEEDSCLQCFLANQYILWMTVSNIAKQNEIEDLLKKMKNYWHLVDYDVYPYVKQVKRFKWLGFEKTRKLLGLYKKIRG